MLKTHHPTLSPSSFPMLEQCPCFERADDAVMLQPREQAESYRDHGNLMHKVFDARMKGETSHLEAELTPFEIEGIDWAVDFVRFHVKVDDPDEPVQIEKRLVLWDDEFNIVTFGTADVLQGPQLFDLKTGDYHAYRPQIDVYALAHMNFEGYDEMVTYLLFTRFKKVHEIRITLEDAKKRVMGIVAKVMDPDRKPRTNPFCKWCRKVMTCEAVGYLVIEDANNYEITDPAELATALERAAIIKEWAHRVEQFAKNQAIAGTEIPGYYLKSRQGAREIADVKRAYELSGLIPDTFIGLCSLGIGRLEDALAKAEGLSKSKAKKMITERLAEVIVRRPPTISLAKTETETETETET